VESIWEKPPYNSGALFKDKIVLIGAAGNVAEDRLQTPFGAALGPTIHLSAINAALNRDFLHETSRAANLALILAAGALAWLLCAGIRKPLVRLVVLSGALAAYYGVVQWLFNATGFFPVLLSPLLALGTSGIAWSVWEQVLDLRDKARLRRTFERYVSRDIVKELLDNPQSYLNTLGGQRKQVTVLFSDVRGFTTITESGDEQALVAQLNEYFNEMVNIVFRHHGTLDKFIGDAVMAQWGGIVTEGEKEDALRAVTTAVEMRKTLVRLNEDWARREMIELKFGIGVNQGQAIVGNLGCDAKMEVSLIGDAVNTASRFEGMTKQFHVDLLIGETVARLVREKFIVRSVALSQPKGKTKPVEIFTVLDERGAGTTEPAWLADYEEGVRQFRAREFAAAISSFESALRENPGDWLIEHYYLEQCRGFVANPPPPDWTAVDVMTSK
jgi:adenylate cyclase